MNSLLRGIKIFFMRMASVILLPRVLMILFDILKYHKRNKGNVSIIILYEHIGDIIACEPVSSYLSKYKKNKVVWIVNKKYASILTLFDNVDKTIKVETFSEVVYLNFFLSSLRTYNLHLDGKQCTRFYLTLHNKNRKYTTTTFLDKGSLLEIFSETANLPRLNIRPHLAINNCEDRFPELNYPFVAIHVVANDKVRMWDINKWERLIEYYPNIQFVEIGLHPSLRPMPNYITEYCGTISLVDIAYLLKKCIAFVGIESSIGHYANALNKPSLVLTGKIYNFKAYNPYCMMPDNSKLIQYPGPLNDLPFNLVTNELDKILFGIN